MKTIASYLKKQDIKAWQLSRIYKQNHEVYMIGNRIEAVRCNTNTNYSLLVHRNSQEPECIGESRAEFQLLPRVWRKLVMESIERADLIQNPFYELSEAWDCDTSQNPIFDHDLAENLMNNLSEASEAIFSASSDQLSGCRLASSELFFEKFQTTQLNSNGFEISFPSTKILWDFVLLSPDSELEINIFSKGRFLKKFNWLKILSQEASYLVSLEEANLPPTNNAPVVLADEALDTLFDYFVSQSNGGALFHGFSTFELNKPVYRNGKLNQRQAKEALTLETDPFIEGALNSGFTDELGFPLKKQTIIENGFLKNFSIDGKFSSLLNKPRTTKFSNVKIPPGKNSYDSFLEDGVFELLRFSTFQPNPITGAFSGEIRLGYLYKNGKKIPIRGGSVSGISQEAFQRAYYSKETVLRESYLGPKGVFFEELTLAGK